MVDINHPLLFNLLSVEMQELYLKMIIQWFAISL